MATTELSAADADVTWHLAEQESHDHGGNGATMIGFWIYLMSDALIFAALFATFGVLSTAYAGGPGPREVFELPLVAVNTPIGFRPMPRRPTARLRGSPRRWWSPTSRRAARAAWDMLTPMPVAFASSRER